MLQLHEIDYLITESLYEGKRLDWVKAKGAHAWDRAKHPVKMLTLAKRTEKAGKEKVAKAHVDRYHTRLNRAQAHVTKTMTNKRRQLADRALKKANKTEVHGHTMVQRAKKSKRVRTPQVVATAAGFVAGSPVVLVPASGPLAAVAAGEIVRHGPKKAGSRLAKKFSDSRGK